MEQTITITNSIITNIVTNYLYSIDMKMNIWSKKFIFIEQAKIYLPILFLIISCILLTLFLIYIIRDVNRKWKFITLTIGLCSIVAIILIFLASLYIKEDLKKEISYDIINILRETNKKNIISNNIYLTRFYQTDKSFYYDVILAKTLDKKESAILFDYRSYILSNDIISYPERWSTFMNYFCNK